MKMDSIFAIIDAQGFYINNEFSPRELALAHMDGSEIASWEITPNVKYEDLSPQEQKLNEFIEKYTGLPYEPFTIRWPLERMKSMIAMIYTKLFTLDRPNFGIRNHQFGRYLASIGLPFVQIDCPSIYTLLRVYGQEECPNHIIKKDGMCAINKVRILRQWVLDNKDFKLYFVILFPTAAILGNSR